MQYCQYSFMLPSLVQRWRCEKWGYQSSSISWMTDMAIPAKGRVLGPKSKLNGSLLRGKQTLLEEMANDSEARLDNLGIELGTGPMLGRDPCWGQEDSRGEMPAQQGRRRWWLTESSVAPRTDPSASHPALEVALLLAQLCSCLKQLPAQPGEHWVHAGTSIRGLWKLSFKHCGSHNRCFGDAEVESSWRSKDMKIS